MKKSLFAGSVLVAAASLSITGCAQPPGAETSGAPSGEASSAAGSSSAASFKACMVSDSGGFDDKSFNQTSYKGLTDAVSKLGIQSGQVESQNTNDFAKNIDSMVKADCNVIVTVGFLLGDATKAAAKANPDIDFAIVDNNPEASTDNVKPLEFNTAQSSFMAGYLAAATTKTGKVATFGGAKIPTVTIFMDGFSQGVDYYNTQKGKSVQLLGWDADKQDGTFVPPVGDQSPFDNVGGAKVIAGNLVSQGADILFPVAGPAGEGALQTAKANGDKVAAIWVDTDGCVSASAYCANIMTSVYKGMDVAVADVIENSFNDKYDNTAYVGTLENDGTGLSDYHDFDSKVPADVKAEVEQLKADIIGGKIKITSKSQTF